MPLKTGAPRGVIVCNRAFNIRKIGARGRNLLPMGFFSILRFNMRKEQIARFSQPRNPRGKHSPSVSARSVQSEQTAQAEQAKRQRAQSPQSAQSVRKIPRFAHFAQYFLSGSAYGEGGNTPQSIKNLFKKQPARGRRLKIIAPFFRCENLFDVGF